MLYDLDYQAQAFWDNFLPVGHSMDSGGKKWPSLAGTGSRSIPIIRTTEKKIVGKRPDKTLQHIARNMHTMHFD